MALLLFVCVLFWGTHKSLAPRARTLLGGLGQGTLSFFAVATLLFFFFVGVLNFATSPNSGLQFLRGFLRSEKMIFCFISSGCASFSWFFFLLLRGACVSLGIEGVWPRRRFGDVAGESSGYGVECLGLKAANILPRGP